jgi:hypothetical protein
LADSSVLADRYCDRFPTDADYGAIVTGEAAIQAMSDSQYAKYRDDERRAFDKEMLAMKKM